MPTCASRRRKRTCRWRGSSPWCFLPAIIVGIGGWTIPGNVFGSDSTDAFLFATIPVIIFFVSLYVRASLEDRKPLVALLSIFAVAIAFWAVFKQNGTALTTWAQYYTDRELPAAIVPAADALYLVEKPVNAIDTTVAYDDEFKVVKVDGKEQLVMDKPVYFKNLRPDRLPPEGEPAYILNTEIYQSINPFWVVILDTAGGGLLHLAAQAEPGAQHRDQDRLGAAGLRVLDPCDGLGRPHLQQRGDQGILLVAGRRRTA